MSSFYFGVFIGIFLCFAGQRFIAWLVKAIKERKTKELKRTEEVLQQMIDKRFEGE